MLNSGQNCWFFVLRDLEILWMILENNRAPFLYYVCASFQIHRWIKTGVTLNWGQNWQFFVACDLEIWRMTLKNNRAPLLCTFKLCASFYSHLWIQTGVTVRKCPMRVKIGDFYTTFVHHFKSIGELKLEKHSIGVKIGNFLSRVTLKFEGWPWKTIGHLFYAHSSFVHHFIAIFEFKLELQSGNAQCGSKSVIFCPLWPCNLMDDLEKQ